MSSISTPPKHTQVSRVKMVEYIDVVEQNLIEIGQTGISFVLESLRPITKQNWPYLFDTTGKFVNFPHYLFGACCDIRYRKRILKQSMSVPYVGKVFVGYFAAYIFEGHKRQISLVIQMFYYGGKYLLVINHAPAFYLILVIQSVTYYCIGFSNVCSLVTHVQCNGFIITF